MLIWSVCGPDWLCNNDTAHDVEVALIDVFFDSNYDMIIYILTDKKLSMTLNMRGNIKEYEEAYSASVEESTCPASSSMPLLRTNAVVNER